MRTLSDTELLIAQGSENLARADLSYIERAHFAGNMVQAGVARDVIAKAMGTQATPCPSTPRGGRGGGSRRRSCRRLARSRRRAAALAHPGRSDQGRDAGDDRHRPRLPDLAGKPSDERFAVILAALAASPPRKAAASRDIEGFEGLRFARVERSTSRRARDDR